VSAAGAKDDFRGNEFTQETQVRAHW
jgi:hypothetical protein